MPQVKSQPTTASTRGGASRRGGGDVDFPQPVAIESQPFSAPAKKPMRLLSNKALPAAPAPEEPAAKSKTRRATRPDLKDEKAVEEAGLQRKAISEEILFHGCVQSFVDFFYLTHRPDPRGDREEGTEGAMILIPTSEMIFIKDNLMKAELARRKGETSEAFNAYETLATLYQDLDDAKTSVYFFEKCLEIARITGDRQREMLSNSRLGVVYERAQDLGSAIAYHERHRELATAQDNKREVQKANSELLKVYMRFADEKEKAGAHDEAVKYFEKCLDAAKKAEDLAAEGGACYRLGKAYIASKSQYDIAIRYLTQYEMISSSLKDMEGQGKAYEALAQAYQRVNDDEKGVTFLESFLKMATSTNNLKGQADACSDLGVILSRRRQYKGAVTNFARKYEITRDLLHSGQGSTKQMSEAQIYLGIAKGNAIMAPFVNSAIHDVPTLLDFKITHNEAKYGAKR